MISTKDKSSMLKKMQETAERLLKQQDEVLRQKGCFYQCKICPQNLFPATLEGNEWKVRFPPDQIPTVQAKHDILYVEDTAPANCIETALCVTNLVKPENETEHQFLTSLVEKGELIIVNLLEDANLVTFHPSNWPESSILHMAVVVNHSDNVCKYLNAIRDIKRVLRTIVDDDTDEELRVKCNGKVVLERFSAGFYLPDKKNVNTIFDEAFPRDGIQTYYAFTPPAENDNRC
jgi:hypothetical protein